MSETKKNPKWLSLAIFIAVITGVYFGNVALQTHLGRNVLAGTGLELRSFDEALVESKASGKPVLVAMSAIWCPSCRTFDKNVLSDPAVNALIRERFVFARVEYEDEGGRAFMERYGVKGFPHVFVVDSEGEVIKELRIMRKAEAFLMQLEEVVG